MAKGRFIVACLMAGLSFATIAETDTAQSTNNLQADRSRFLEATAAIQRGDYVIAYCYWHSLAEKGDADAQYALGWMYHNGYGLATDDRAARAWWEKAIAQGNTDAMFSLGTLYSAGSETVERDYSAAMRLWLRAAAAGNQNAQFALHELVQRNLPELASLTRMLRVQYPQIIGKAEPRKNPKDMRRNAPSENKLAEDLPDPSQNPLEQFEHSGELIAVAAGYRHELGWAAQRLIMKGELIFIAEPAR